MPTILSAVLAAFLLIAIIVAITFLIFAGRLTAGVILRRIDSRGWLAIGNWALVLLVLLLMATVPDLRKDDLFKMIAQGLVMSGFINLVLAFYFTASKSDGQHTPSPPAPPASV
jgi:hypothetical protein